MKAHVHTKTLTWTYIRLFCNSQNLKTIQMSINRWLDKEIVLYPCNGLLSNNTKEWTIYMCNNMGKYQNNYAKKEARQKRVHPVQFHFYKTLENANLSIAAKSKPVIPEEGKEVGIPKGHKEILGETSVFLALLLAKIVDTHMLDLTWHLVEICLNLRTSTKFRHFSYLL